MTADAMKTLGPDDLAKLLRRKASTIRTDANRRPESLPPRLRVPGTRTLLWLESDVVEWLKKCRTESAA